MAQKNASLLLLYKMYMEWFQDCDGESTLLSHDCPEDGLFYINLEVMFLRYVLRIKSRSSFSANPFFR